MTAAELDALYEGWDLTALCAWREARGEGELGMQAVCCILANRVKRNNSSFDAEVLKPWQFTSMTVDGDPEIHLFPKDGDPPWISAKRLAGLARAGTLRDLTGGATLYYNPRAIVTRKQFGLPDGSQIPFPQRWNPAVVRYVTRIQRHVFFTEEPCLT